MDKLSHSHLSKINKIWKKSKKAKQKNSRMKTITI